MAVSKCFPGGPKELILRPNLISTVKMVERQIIRLSVLFFLSQISHRVVSQCSFAGTSELGWRLQGHTYRKMKAVTGLDCAFECHKEEICQSLNFVLSVGVCEFNNRTKEAKPKEFVPDQDAYYVKRFLKRGKNLHRIFFSS